jgi:hypothetical protein
LHPARRITPKRTASQNHGAHQAVSASRIEPLASV